MAKKKKKTRKTERNRDSRLIAIVVGLLSLGLALIGMFELGLVGQHLSAIFRLLFGRIYFLALLFVIFTSSLLLLRNKYKLNLRLHIGLLLGVLSSSIWFAIPEGSEKGMAIITDFFAQWSLVYQGSVDAMGGAIGAILYGISSMLFDKNGTYIVLSIFAIITLVLIVNISAIKVGFLKIRDFLFIEEEEAPVKKPPIIDYLEADIPEKIETKSKKKSVFMDTDRPSTGHEPVEKEVRTSSIGSIETNTHYQLPSVELLDKVKARQKSNANRDAAIAKGGRVIEILEEFGIKSTLIATHIGPSVTKFEVKPESNVKVSKIAAISDNIKMELAARDIRIEAPIPGRSAVGIEIPNVEITPVRMSELLRGLPEESKHPLTFALGKDLMGKTVECKLDKMPHLLIAGATGSGKSVCINSLITTILLRTSPNDVKLLLIDPKKVEFTHYVDIPHLIGEVISDSAKASKALSKIVEIMENRYECFSKHGVRNIDSYNELVEQKRDLEVKKMPWIVVIIDELADLMAVAGKDVEQSVQRITQLARAAGIHLIVATQRPSTDVITGIIKANIPSRIAFAVSSGIDSRTILDQMGAERLLGNGDMLYFPIGDSSPTRLQGVYVSDEEISRIANFAKSQMKPIYDDAFVLGDDHEDSDGNSNGGSDDPLYEEARTFVIIAQKASTSLLQRKFGIGYNRAARIIDILEMEGVIGPQQGSKPRVVLIHREED